MVPRFGFGSTSRRTGAICTARWRSASGWTIYRIDRATNLAVAEFAYDVAEKYTIPAGSRTALPATAWPALRGVRVPVRPHLGTAGVAPDVPGRVSSVPPACTAATSTTGGSAPVPRCITRYRYRVHCSRSAIRTSRKGDGEIQWHRDPGLARRVVQVQVRKDFTFGHHCWRPALLDRARLRRGPERGHA